MLGYSICVVPLRQERPYHSDSTASFAHFGSHCWFQISAPPLYSFCSNRLVWHAMPCAMPWHGMVVKLPYDNMYLLCFFLLTCVGAVSLECMNNELICCCCQELSCMWMCVNMLPISPERWWKAVVSFSVICNLHFFGSVSGLHFIYSVQFAICLPHTPWDSTQAIIQYVPPSFLFLLWMTSEQGAVPKERWC